MAVLERSSRLRSEPQRDGAFDGACCLTQARAIASSAPLDSSKLVDFSAACQQDFAQALAFPFGLAAGAQVAPQDWRCYPDSDLVDV